MLKSHPSVILGIESSCDEAALALFEPQFGIRGEWLASQLAVQKLYGGVVPDVASREHVKNFRPLLEQLGVHPGMQNLQQIAVTHGPGLAPCLAVGICVAQALSLSLGVPLVGVNHLRGHMWSPFIALHAADPQGFRASLQSLLPHLGLLVSGGNTLIFKIDTDLSVQLIAQTVDDAAGEALDKGARLLGLPYPGGPHIEQLARTGDPKRYDFPRALGSSQDLRLSFSGLKTSLRYKLEKDKDTLLADIHNLCASYQQAVIDQLLNKTRHVLQLQDFKSLGLSGGVAHNKALRNALQMLADQQGVPLYLPKPEHTGDNAAMIAFAAYVENVSTIPQLDPSLTIV